jgi:hypothetical protein
MECRFWTGNEAGVSRRWDTGKRGAPVPLGFWRPHQGVYKILAVVGLFFGLYFPQVTVVVVATCVLVLRNVHKIGRACAHPAHSRHRFIQEACG